MTKKKLKSLDKKLDKINYSLEKMRVLDILDIIDNKKQIFIRNFISGIARGVGIGIGISVITAILIYTLNYIVRLNIPVIGDYIVDIVDIVETNRK